MPAFREVQWAKGRKDDFRSWLHNELTHCLGDRSRLETKWRNNIIQWRARVIGDGVTDVPFIGAADFEVPLTDMHVQPVVSDFMQSLHAPKDFWSITGIRPDGVEKAGPLQEFLSLVEKRDIRMRGVNQRAVLDQVVHGTSIYKDYILHERIKRQDYNAAGEIEDVTRLKFQPKITHIPLKDFFIPAYAWNIDPDDVGGAPWVGQRYRLTRNQFLAQAQAGPPYLPAYDKKAVERVKSWETDVQGIDKVETTIRSEDEYQPYRDAKIVLYEVWARFDVDGDDIDEDVRIIWHQDTEEILLATYNPMVHGKRPFSAAKYLPFFGFYGLGLAEADEWAQLSISRLFNSTINNAELANTVMLSVPLGANIMPDQELHAGKVWPTGPGEKVSPIEMGRPYPGMFQIIDGISQWSEQRTAVNELRQGSVSSLPSRTPASTVMQLLGESNKRFDMIMANTREGPLGSIGMRCLQNLIQISKDDPRYIGLAIEALGQEDGLAVADVLQGSLHDLETNFGVTVTATSSKVNKEVDKQTMVQLAQYWAQSMPIALQYVQAMVQMQAAPPELLVSTLQAGYNSTIELQKRLLQSYDIQNPEQYLPAPIGPQQQQQAAQQPGAGPGAAGPQAAPLGGTTGAAPLAQGEAQLAALLGL